MTRMTQMAPGPAARICVICGWLAALALFAGCGAAKGPAPGTPPATVEEFTQLRATYGDRDDFAARCEAGRAQGMREVNRLAEAGNWEGVLAITMPWVRDCPVDVMGRHITAAALTQLGRSDEAHDHVLWYRGLIESVLTSGDGRAPQTAFVVISVAEEYAVLRALQLQPQKQALLDGGIDAITVQSARGTGTIYFNPAAHFRRLERGAGAVETAP